MLVRHFLQPKSKNVYTFFPFAKVFFTKIPLFFQIAKVKTLKF